MQMHRYWRGRCNKLAVSNCLYSKYMSASIDIDKLPQWLVLWRTVRLPIEHQLESLTNAQFSVLIHLNIDDAAIASDGLILF